MKNISILLLGLGIAISLQGQNYTQTLGIRGGEKSGVMYSHFMDQNNAHELLLQMKTNQLNLTYLRVIYSQNEFGLVPNFIFYKGLGGHIGYRYQDQYSMFLVDYSYASKKFSPVLGFDAFVGMEYRIEGYPIAIGLDYKPYFEFSTRQIYKLQIFDIALNLKYRF